MHLRRFICRRPSNRGEASRVVCHTPWYDGRFQRSRQAILSPALICGLLTSSAEEVFSMQTITVVVCSLVLAVQAAMRRVLNSCSVNVCSARISIFTLEPTQVAGNIVV